MKRKTLQDLTITDDWMFKQVFSDEAICIRFLSELLGPVESVSFKEGTTSYQEVTIPGHPGKKGVRMDVIMKSGRTLYDIEMQTTDEQNLEKRIRYYQGMMDSRFLPTGRDYSRLPSTYIIFLCTFDPVGVGIPIYQRYSCYRSLYTESDLSEYADGSHVIVLNSMFTHSPVDTEITDFLHYVRTGNYTLELQPTLTSLVQNKISEVVADKRKEGAFSMYENELRNEERVAFIARLFKHGGFTEEQMAELSALPLSRVREVISALKSGKRNGVKELHY